MELNSDDFTLEHVPDFDSLTCGSRPLRFLLQQDCAETKLQTKLITRQMESRKGTRPVRHRRWAWFQIRLRITAFFANSPWKLIHIVTLDHFRQKNTWLSLIDILQYFRCFWYERNPPKSCSQGWLRSPYPYSCRSHFVTEKRQLQSAVLVARVFVWLSLASNSSIELETKRYRVMGLWADIDSVASRAQCPTRRQTCSIVLPLPWNLLYLYELSVCIAFIHKPQRV